MEGRIKMITREYLPCWYELSWQDKKSGQDGPEIILSIHEDFIRSQGQIPLDAPIVKAYLERFECKNFQNDFDGNFGFDGNFVSRGKENGFVRLAAKLPIIKIETKGKCSRCQGTGEDKFFDGRCSRCEGTGKEHKYDWLPAFRISATFTVFFLFARSFQKETGAGRPQLLTVQTRAERDMHGGSLSGAYSVDLVKWLGTLGEGATIEEMVKAMKKAYQYMFVEKENEVYSRFSARITDRQGWLNVDCPGDACGLNPSHGAEYDMKKGGMGYEFSCHNVDSPMQQLTLLAGLAALHDRARKEIK